MREMRFLLVISNGLFVFILNNVEDIYIIGTVIEVKSHFSIHTVGNFLTWLFISTKLYDIIIILSFRK